MYRWVVVASLVTGCGRLHFDETGTGDGAILGGGATAITAGDSFGCALLATRKVACWGDGRVGQLGHGVLELRTSAVTLPNLDDVRAIDAGFAHACALDGSGRVFCWGQNQRGELAQPAATILNPVPQQVALPQTAVAIAVGGYHGCATLSDRSLWCWGQNDSGQTGVAAPAIVRTPVQAFDDVVEASLGEASSCARRSDDTVWCWGNNIDGKLGDGTTTSRPTPMPASGLVAHSIACGDKHCCAILDEGRYTCWGQNNAGELGDGTKVNRSTPNPPSTLTGVTQIGAGDDHNCAAFQDGKARCWGWNLFGGLGTGDVYTTSGTPLEVQVSGRVIAASAGGTFSCVLRDNGTVACFGSGARGELANGIRGEWSPKKVTLPGPALALTASTSHACAVVGDSAYCWGANDVGQLGTGGPAVGSSSPVAVAGLTNVTAIGSGTGHTCALSGAKLSCWGNNALGELGDGTTTRRTTPVMSLLTSGTQMAGGIEFTCARDSTGLVSCWGSDSTGQIRNGGVMSTSPVGVANNALTIAAGDVHACALGGGGLSCWGGNADGRLGIGTTGGMALPTAVPGTFTLIAAHYARSCAVGMLAGDPAGSTYCWGRSDGAIGDDAFQSRATPTRIAVGGTVQSIGIGQYHTCAATSTGLWCWGQNDQGELGDGTGMYSGTPSLIPTSFMPVEVVSGFRYSCARDTVGDVWCWGGNDNGALGLGTTSRSPLPLEVTLPLD